MYRMLSDTERTPVKEILTLGCMIDTPYTEQYGATLLFSSKKANLKVGNLSPRRTESIRKVYHESVEEEVNLFAYRIQPPPTTSSPT